MLPYIKEIGKTRSYIGEFRGYNHNARISEYEIYDGYNMSNDEYPVLSTRKPRGVLAEGTVPLGLYGKNGLCKIYHDGISTRFEYNGKEYDDLPLDYEYEGLRRIVGFGARLLIYPDNVWFDTVTGKSGKALSTVRIKEITLTVCQLRDHGDGEVEYYDFDVGDGVYSFSDDEGAVYIVDSNGVIVSHTLAGGVYVENDDLAVRIDGIEAELGGAISLSPLEGRLSPFVSGSKIEKASDGKYYIKGMITYRSRGYNSISIRGGDSLTLARGAKPSDEDVTLTKGECYWYAEIRDVPPPLLDFVVECQNRLWGCRKGENRAGAVVNEIYATRLGTFDDWYSYEDTADSPYVASIGTPGEFTGAIALSQNPIFFKENAIHKVYVSSSGAHQIYTYDVRGVQRGSGGSIAIVNETAYFKGVRDVFAFDGTNVSPISDALGDVRYFNALAGADGDKYVMYCEDSANGRYIFTYDTRKGFWQRELIDERVDLMCEENGRLLLGTESGIFSHEASPGEVSESRVRYMLETGEIGFESADARFLCRLDLRVKLGFGSTMTVWVEYDSDGGWCEAVRHRGTTVVPRLETVNILPRRAGHFKIRITGTGEMRLYGMQRIYEESTG